MHQYDYLIVGSGLFGSVFAYEMNKAGKKCLVIEKNNHIGGNCYSENRDGINIHIYGPHIFHTNDIKIWNWINQFVQFNDFTLRSVANYKGEIYSLPFNMLTFSKLWNISHPEQAKKIINEQSREIQNPQNLEQQAIKLVGKDVYLKLIKGYTEKQWRKPANELPKEIIKRLPVRFTYDNNYFNDKYQGIPIGGYTQIFQKLLNGIECKVNINYLENRNYWDNLATKIVYTGAIDAFFEYKYGALEYKSLRFDHKKMNYENHQGVAIMNYTDIDVPYTRTVEHKFFENAQFDCTWVTWEYPIEYKSKISDPYYPVNDSENNKKLLMYNDEAKLFSKIIFGGRLAEYKYYDMHQVIDASLSRVKKELGV